MIGKAAIFLKHRAGKIGGMFRGKDLKNKTTIAKFKAKKAGSKVGSFVKKEAKEMVDFYKFSPGLAIGTAVTGLSLGTGLNYLTKNTNKKELKKKK